MSWRVAYSLLVLRDQIDDLYPGRSKASDGTIGDAAHQAEQSDHNPDANGVVRALDITHDPLHGCDIDKLSDALCMAQDNRVNYIIANRLITGPNYGWIWDSYDGADPHTNHIHISVTNAALADMTYAWCLPGLPGDEEMTAVQINAEDPWEKELNQAAELRHTYYALATGFRDSKAVASQNGVIARLDRIEKAQAQVTKIDYTELAKALWAELLPNKTESK